MFVLVHQSRVIVKESKKYIINENIDKIDVVISNHIGSLDFLYLASILKQYNIDNYSFIFRKESRYLAGLGFSIYIDSDIIINKKWEEDKKLIANMAEKGKDGSYTVKIDGKTKNVDDLSKTDIDNLIEESKKAPPTIEKLAEDQLGVLKNIETAIKSSGDLTGLALSKSETGSNILKTAKTAVTASKELIPEQMQDSSKYGKKIDEIAADIAAGNLGGAFTTLKDFVETNLMTALKNLSTGINTVANSITNTPVLNPNNSSSQLPTNTNNQNQSSATGTNNQNTSSTVNVNYNVNVTANGNNVNTDMVKQAVAEAITNEKTVSAIRDGFEKLYPKKGAA